MDRIVETPLRPVPFKVTNPERIPVQRYYDGDFYKLEAEYLWPHVWQMACRLEEIPKVGDWIEYQILDKSVIVVRTKDGDQGVSQRVPAPRRTAGERARQLQERTASSARSTAGDGTWMARTPSSSGGRFSARRIWTRSDLALVPCRVESWGGCAFINFDDHAPPLRDSLGPLAERLEAHHVDKLKVDWWYAAVLPVNWKLAMEAFMEGYHVMRTHPQLHALTPPEWRAVRIGRRHGHSCRQRQMSSQGICRLW